MSEEPHTITYEQLAHIADVSGELCREAEEDHCLLAANAWGALTSAAGTILELIHHELLDTVCTEPEGEKPHLAIVKDPPDGGQGG